MDSNTSVYIKSIELSNFMCHKNFKMEFNDSITCIGGVNGSGKSAIMISLGILFGQNARNLERGTSYKELIRTDCSCAIIIVKVGGKTGMSLENTDQKSVFRKNYFPERINQQN